MPAYPVIDDTFRVTMNWSHSADGKTAHNVLHFFSTDLEEADLAAILDSDLNADLWGCCGGSFEVTSLDIIKLDGVSASLHFPISTGSGSSGDYIPQGCAVVNLATGLRGQANRGRVYLPFVAESAQTAGVIASGTVSSMQSEWDDFVDAHSASISGILGVASYEHEVFHPVVKATVRSMVATQRRRQGRIS